jgi:uncharacterized DUF497 family protein
VELHAGTKLLEHGKERYLSVAQGMPVRNLICISLGSRQGHLLLYAYIVRTFHAMDDLRFEWDPAKATVNLRKHGVSFNEAKTVFDDEHALLLDDPDHSATEDRFVLLGLSAMLRTVVVVHCYRENDEVVRFISARKATRAEQRQYEERWRS